MTYINVKFQHPYYDTSINVDITSDITVHEVVQQLLKSGFVAPIPNGYDLYVHNKQLQAIDKMGTVGLSTGSTIQILEMSEGPSNTSTNINIEQFNEFSKTLTYLNNRIEQLHASQQELLNKQILNTQKLDKVYKETLNLNAIIQQLDSYIKNMPKGSSVWLYIGLGIILLLSISAAGLVWYNEILEWFNNIGD